MATVLTDTTIISLTSTETLVEKDISTLTKSFTKTLREPIHHTIYRENLKNCMNKQHKNEEPKIQNVLIKRRNTRNLQIGLEGLNWNGMGNRKSKHDKSSENNQWGFLPPPQRSQISINDSIEFFVDFDEKNDTADVETKEELKERREQEQTVLEEKLIKIDRLTNKEFLVRSGQVGIQYNRIGSLLVFGDEFLMMLKFKFPFKDFKLIKMVGKGSCSKFVESLPKVQKQTSSSSTDLDDVLKNVCESFETSMQAFTEQIEATAESSLNDFKLRQLSRTKRFDPVSMAIIGTGVAITWGLWASLEILNGKHERKQLFKRVASLEEDLQTLAEGVKVLGDSLVGFANQVSSALEDHEKKLEMLKNFTIQQAVDTRYALTNLTRFMDDKVLIIAIMSVLNDFRLSQANILQNSLTILLDGIQTYEVIFSTLQRGVLPHQLLDWPKFERLLMEIQREHKDFQFTIPVNHKSLYYSLPLVGYSIDPKTNDIYVSLRIPLSRAGEPRIYSMVKPQGYPFPCLTENCFAYDNIQRMVSFELTDKIWLVNPLSDRLAYEIDPENIECQYTGHSRSCFTFQTNSKHEPSVCSDAVFSWNETLIMRHCPLKPSLKSEYQPILISQDEFVIHKNAVPKIDMFCEQQKGVHLEMRDWAEILKLEKGCNYYFPDHTRVLYGPYQKVLKSNTTYETTTYHSSILEMIETANNQSKIDFDELIVDRPDLPAFKPFNLSENPLVIDWDPTMLSRFTSYVNKMNVNISTALQTVEKIMGRRSGSYSVKGLVNTLTLFTQFLMTCIVVLGIVNYSRFIGHTASLTLIAPRKARAELFGLTAEIMPVDFQTLIDIIVFALMIMVITIFIKIRYFRKHNVTVNYGKNANVEDTGTGWTVVLSIIDTRIGICTVNTDNIFLRFPVTAIQGRQISDLRLVNTAFTWVVVKISTHLYFKLVEDIHLFSINSDGARDFDTWQRVLVKVDDLVYHYEPIPLAFMAENNFGEAHASLARDMSTFH